MLKNLRVVVDKNGRGDEKVKKYDATKLLAKTANQNHTFPSKKEHQTTQQSSKI